MKSIPSRAFGAFFLASACVLLVGCSNNDYSLSAKDVAAFKDATPELKQDWEKGLKADKANDYLAASTNFRSLMSSNITPEQLVAVQTALGGLNQRMNEAAARGDAPAQKALDTLKSDAARR